MLPVLTSFNPSILKIDRGAKVKPAMTCIALQQTGRASQSTRSSNVPARIIFATNSFCKLVVPCEEKLRNSGPSASTVIV